MKAAVHYQYGPPEVMRIAHIDRPEPGPGDILIRVQASSVNRTDAGFRSAEYVISRFFSGLWKPRNPVLGCEYAGTVEAVGEGVVEFVPGDRVFGYDDARFGGQAEYKVASASGAVATIPEGMSFETAAVLTEGAHYALCDLRAAQLRAGQDILINGGTGAIGSAAIQLSKHLGARVTAVCATPHLETVRSIGADTVIDYTREDFTQLDARFHIVFDAVGKSTFGKCRRILHPKGIYMSTEFGPGGQNIPLALITPLFRGRKLIFPLPSIVKEDVLFLRSLAEQGKFRPLIDKKYALDDIVAAYRYVETGMKVGNVVVVPGP